MSSCRMSTSTSTAARIAALLLVGCAEEPLELPPGECTPSPSGFRVFFDGPFGEEIGPALVEYAGGAVRVRFENGFMLDMSGPLGGGKSVEELIPEGPAHARVAVTEGHGASGVSRDVDVAIWSRGADGPGELLFAAWAGNRLQSPVESGEWHARPNWQDNDPVDRCETQRYEVDLDVVADSWSESIGPGCEVSRGGFRFVNGTGWHYVDVNTRVCSDEQAEFSTGWILNEAIGS